MTGGWAFSVAIATGGAGGVGATGAGEAAGWTGGGSAVTLLGASLLVTDDAASGEPAWLAARIARKPPPAISSANAPAIAKAIPCFGFGLGPGVRIETPTPLVAIPIERA